MSKWRVVKRDGAWQTIDPNGEIRYASRSWMSAYTWALMGAEPDHAFGHLRNGLSISFTSEDLPFLEEMKDDPNWIRKWFEKNGDQ